MRFNEQQIRNIRERWWNGATQYSLAQELGVCTNTIKRVIKGDTYKSVPGHFSRVQRSERNKRVYGFCPGGDSWL
jgi:uncharacterized protein YjcR